MFRSQFCFCQKKMFVTFKKITSPPPSSHPTPYCKRVWPPSPLLLLSRGDLSLTSQPGTEAQHSLAGSVPNPLSGCSDREMHDWMMDFSDWWLNDRFLNHIKLELRSQRWSMPKMIKIGAVVQKIWGNDWLNDWFEWLMIDWSIPWPHQTSI